jgi:signal transduction histidine kinase
MDTRGAWFWWLAFGLGVSILFFLLPGANTLIWGLIGYPAAAMTVLGAWRNHPSTRLPWLSLAAAQATFVSGDLAYSAIPAAHEPAELQVPSLPDLFYLSTYLLLALGLLLMIRAPADADAGDGDGRHALVPGKRGADGSGRQVAALLDAVTITIGAALLAWTFWIVPYVRDPALSSVHKATAIAFPLGDILLLAVFLAVWTGGARRGLAFRLLGAAVLGTLVADTLYGLRLLERTWQMGGPVDLGWIAFYLGVSAAALHPSMRALTEPPLPTEARLTRWRLLLLAAASLTAPAVLMLQWLRGAPMDIPVIAGACAVLFVLALTRMYLLATQVRTQSERRRLLDQIVRATESERVRIAGDLHDGPIQKLTALSFTAYRARRKLARQDPAAADDLLASLEGSLEHEVQVLRKLMVELRPPALERQGLEEALHEQVRSFAAKAEVDATMDVRLDVGRLAPDLETLVYRVVQEALTNVAKHARATRVRVSLAADDRLVRLSVADDGVGFAPDRAAARMREGHLGLVGMRDRVTLAGGRLEVRGSPREGTRLEVTIPPRAGATPA